MGKKQRHSEFIGLTAEEVAAIAKNASTPKALRRKAIAELKYRGKRNTQKRNK